MTRLGEILGIMSVAGDARQSGRVYVAIACLDEFVDVAWLRRGANVNESRAYRIAVFRWGSRLDAIENAWWSREPYGMISTSRLTRAQQRVFAAYSEWRAAPSMLRGIRAHQVFLDDHLAPSTPLSYAAADAEETIALMKGER